MNKSIEFSSIDRKHLFVINVDKVTIHRLKKDESFIYEALVTDTESIEINEDTFNRIREIKLSLGL